MPKKKEKGDSEKKPENTPKLSKEMEDKLKELRGKLEKFKDRILEKFDKYIMGVILLPPEQPRPAQPVQPGQNGQPAQPEQPKTEKIDVLVLVDDSDVKKMTKWELRDKLVAIFDQQAKEIDERFRPDPLLLSELWQSCYDGKYELLRLIAMGAPVYDTGMLGAIKLAEIHKSMVLKKFEKYIVAYVLAGSLVQGKATSSSDVDVWIVIDDTDVKKMTRVELKDKLRAIIIGMGVEAGEITGIKNKINIQVYIVTDFWDSLREANPVIFTLLRDGVPFHDRGIFMPWKQLLRMGKIKPSREAIDLFMSTGDQMLQRVQFKLKDIGMEDIYYAILTPSQAALMLYGIPPPTPRETPDMMREIFVKKEKLLEDSFVKILETNIDVRKDIEHGTKKEITGKEVDELLKDAHKYLERVKRLFKQIEKMKEDEGMLHLYERVVTIIRDVLKSEGVDEARDDKVVQLFENELIAKGKVPSKMLRELNEIVAAKKKFDQGKLSKSDIEKARQGSEALIKFLIEYLQRKRGKELERAKIRIKHGEKYGEVLLLDSEAFIVYDTDAEKPTVTKAPIRPDGGLGTTKESSLEEMEKAIAAKPLPQRVFIKEPIFEKLRELFGKDVEVLMSY
ncbi:MAG TPA: nucleotidyltransferase domain-containing protein [Candidatus Nanoarchaeia archaeon]|nr:nucleotidyltransferase domain-containing protein [Candidatus Nanoarchaeia archaeon]